MHLPPAQEPTASPNMNTDKYHGKHRRDDAERGERQARPDHLINQTAKPGQEEEKKQNAAGEWIHAGG